MFPHPRFLCFSLLIHIISLYGVLGNTEIINFSVAEDQSLNLPFTSSWPILNPSAPFLIRNVSSAPLGTKLPEDICATLDEWQPNGGPQNCPHELWIVLDVDQEEWNGFKKFTLRVSWPAYHPTDFSMTIYDPTSLSAFSDPSPSGGLSTTRRKYARIQTVHSGVLTPGVQLDDASRYTVPIHVILEPLHLNVLPGSVIPVVIAILGAVAFGLPIARQINNYLQGIVEQAKQESKPSLKVQ